MQVPRPPLTTVQLLQRVQEGLPGARDELFALVYGELHALARRLMAEERASHTLQATALVHEVWLRIAGDEGGPEGEDRGELLRLAARAMRRVLVDHARRRAAAKRGGGAPGASLEEPLAAWENDHTDLLALDEVLERLHERDEEAAAVVELLFFGGLTQAEAARALGRSTRQVEGTWTFARGWLRRELERGA